MSPLDEFNFDEAMAEQGQRSEHKRRLSDKILAAFNHAYAVGEDDVAIKLRDALSLNEGKSAQHARKGGYERVGYDPLGQADLWVAFVEARNGYKTACETDRSDAAVIATTLESMKDAYRRWSMG